MSIKWPVKHIVSDGGFVVFTRIFFLFLQLREGPHVPRFRGLRGFPAISLETFRLPPSQDTKLDNLMKVMEILKILLAWTLVF